MYVIKRNKRLWIVNDNEDVYCLPDFLRNKLSSRKPLEDLAVALAATSIEDRILEIMKFETMLRE